MILNDSKRRYNSFDISRTRVETNIKCVATLNFGKSFILSYIWKFVWNILKLFEDRF